MMLLDIDFKEFELHSRKLGTLQCCLNLSIYILNCFGCKQANRNHGDDHHCFFLLLFFFFF
jgi:hypothetical protein